jgi:transcriptional regulator with XRE-family HTH domain
LSKVIGKFIKVRRSELGLSQNDLARALGYNTSQYISNIERGLASIPFAKIQEMAQLLKVEYRHLLNLKLMEEVPGFKQEFLAPPPQNSLPEDAGPVQVPVMTPELVANWSDIADLDFPRKICSRYEYAHTDDEHAFYFQVRVSAPSSWPGIQDGDLLLVEPSKDPDRGQVVLSLLNHQFRLGKLVPRNGEVILQPLDPHLDVEIFRRKELRAFTVTELKRRLTLN